MPAETNTEIWYNMLKAGGPRQRLLDGHPLHLYFGADAASKPIFFLITSEKPQIPEMSTIVTVERRERADASWAVVLTLQDRSYADAFIGMCMELARRSGESHDAGHAFLAFFETLNQWKALLRHGQAKRLSKEQIRGLVAEIWFGQEYLSDTYTPAEVLMSWNGPYGAPQDYRTPDGRLHEVKSVHGGSKFVEISSVEQLDPIDLAPLTLSLVAVEEIELPSVDSVSLVGLVEQLRAGLAQAAKPLENLEKRFAALGFDPSDESYADLHFVVGGLRSFDVTVGFPRLLREHIPLAVDDVRYQLKLAAIAEFEVLAGPAAHQAH